MIGRDTRESGRGSRTRWSRARSAGGRALRAGVIPTPGVAVLTASQRARARLRHLGIAQPLPRQRDQVHRRRRRKLADAPRRRGEARRRARRGARWTEATVPDAIERLRVLAGRAPTAAAYTRPGGLVVDCANGAASTRRARASLGSASRRATWASTRTAATSTPACGSTHLDAVAAGVRGPGRRAGSPSTATPTAASRSSGGRPVNGDAIIAAIALARGEKRVVVTSMTNLEICAYPMR